MLIPVILHRKLLARVEAGVGIGVTAGAGAGTVTIVAQIVVMVNSGVMEMTTEDIIILVSIGIVVIAEMHEM